MDKEDAVYKTFSTIIAGWLSFYISMHPLSYSIEHQITSINGGLFIPLLISIAWGWRYGLVCCTLGLATQYGLWIWRPSGWGAVAGVTTHTIWVVWHGWWHNNMSCRITKRENSYCWIKPYIGEIIIRSILIISYFLLFPLIMSFNPPFWAMSSSITHVSNAFIETVMLKQLVEGMMWVTLCDILLMNKFIRRCLKLPVDDYNCPKVMQWILLIGCILVGIEAYVSWYLRVNGSFLRLLIYPSIEDVAHRIIIFTTCVWFGIFISKYTSRYCSLHDALEKQNTKYAKYFEELPLPIVIVNSDYKVVQMSKMFREMLNVSNRDQIELLTGSKRCSEYFDFPICNTDKCVLRHPNENNYNVEFLHIGKVGEANYCLSVIHTIKDSDGRMKEMILMYDVERVDDSDISRCNCA